MPNTEAVLPFTSMSRRSSLRTVGAAAALGVSAGEVCARAAIADPARVATPPAMTARRDSMGSLLELVGPGNGPLTVTKSLFRMELVVTVDCPAKNLRYSRTPSAVILISAPCADRLWQL